MSEHLALIVLAVERLEAFFSGAVYVLLGVLALLCVARVLIAYGDYRLRRRVASRMRYLDSSHVTKRRRGFIADPLQRHLAGRWPDSASDH